MSAVKQFVYAMLAGENQQDVNPSQNEIKPVKSMDYGENASFARVDGAALVNAGSSSGPVDSTVNNPGGVYTPVVSDKTPSQLRSFNQLARENEQANDIWLKRLHKVGSIFVLFTVVAVTLMGTVWVWTLFAWPVVPLVLLTLSGLVVEWITYQSSVTDAFKLFFVKGLLKEQENRVLIKKYVSAKEKAANDKFFEDYFPKLKAIVEDKLLEKNGVYKNRQGNKYLTQEYEGKLAEKQKKARTKLLMAYAHKWALLKEKLRCETLSKEQFNNQLNEHINNCPEAEKQLFTHFNQIDNNQDVQRSLKIRKGLTIIGSIFSAVTAFGFFAMTFNSVITCITQLSAVSLAANASLLIKGIVAGAAFINASPVGLLALGISLATLAGIAWGLLMYRTFYGLVSKANIPSRWRDVPGCFLRACKRFLKHTMKVIPEKAWSSHSFKEKVLHILESSLKILFLIAYLSIGIISALLTAGAYIDATVDLMTFFIGPVSKGAIIAANAIVFAVMMPVDSTFTITHSLGAICKAYQFFNEAYRNCIDKQWREGVSQSLSSVLVYAAVCVVFTFLLIGHAVADAAFTSGQGAHSSISLSGKAFRSLMKLLPISPETFAVAADTIVSVPEHGDFVIEMGGWFNEKALSGVETVKSWLPNYHYNTKSQSNSNENETSEEQPLLKI